MGPECAAQQAKNVSASTMNCGDCSASKTPIGEPPMAAPCPALASPLGAWRTRREIGTNRIHTRVPIVSCAVRQSEPETNQAANGEIVIGATPRPADTSDTARARWRSNQELTAAIIGAKKLPAATPTSSPYVS